MTGERVFLPIFSSSLHKEDSLMWFASWYFLTNVILEVSSKHRKKQRAFFLTFLFLCSGAALGVEMLRFVEECKREKRSASSWWR
jgi:hypothetical protein